MQGGCRPWTRRELDWRALAAPLERLRLMPLAFALSTKALVQEEEEQMEEDRQPRPVGGLTSSLVLDPTERLALEALGLSLVLLLLLAPPVVLLWGARARAQEAIVPGALTLLAQVLGVTAQLVLNP